MYVIYRFTSDITHGNSLWEKRFFSLIHFIPFDQIPKIKICHIVASGHPEAIEVIPRLIATDVLDSEEAAEDGFIDNYGAASDEEDECGLGEAGTRTVVTQS